MFSVDTLHFRTGLADFISLSSLLLISIVFDRLISEFRSIYVVFDMVDSGSSVGP